MPQRVKPLKRLPWILNFTERRFVTFTENINDETLLLELARRGYDLPDFDKIDETTVEIVKIG